MSRIFYACLISLFVLVPALARAAVSAAANAPLDIVLRHNLAGNAVEALTALVLRFNDEEAKLKQGGGRVLIEDARSVEDRARLPHLALFDPDDALELFGTRPRFRPLNEVMSAGRQPFAASVFYPQMADAVQDLAGRLQALPLAFSLPALFYNKEAFRQAGLDPEAPPQTWWQLQEVAGRLREAGVLCPLTSSRFAWVHVENVASQHGESIVVKNGKQNQLAVNNLVNVKHMALLTSWQKSRYFIYSGPAREGDERFASGECAMLTGESALYARLAKQKPAFSVGVAPLPHYDDVHGARPAQVLPDGAALWVLAADKKPELAVIARFIGFLLRPEIQRDWVRSTGFLPMTAAAVQALREAGANPQLLAQAEARLMMTKREAARARLGYDKSRIRPILNEEVEFVWSLTKPPKAALDSAVARAAAVLPGRP